MADINTYLGSVSNYKDKFNKLYNDYMARSAANAAENKALVEQVAANQGDGFLSGVGDAWNQSNLNYLSTLGDKYKTAGAVLMGQGVNPQPYMQAQQSMISANDRANADQRARDQMLLSIKQRLLDQKNAENKAAYDMQSSASNAELAASKAQYDAQTAMDQTTYNKQRDLEEKQFKEQVQKQSNENTQRSLALQQKQIELNAQNQAQQRELDKYKLLIEQNKIQNEPLKKEQEKRIESSIKAEEELSKAYDAASSSLPQLANAQKIMDEIGKSSVPTGFYGDIAKSIGQVVGPIIGQDVLKYQEREQLEAAAVDGIIDKVSAFTPASDRDQLTAAKGTFGNNKSPETNKKILGMLAAASNYVVQKYQDYDLYKKSLPPGKIANFNEWQREYDLKHKGSIFEKAGEFGNLNEKQIIEGKKPDVQTPNKPRALIFRGQYSDGKLQLKYDDGTTEVVDPSTNQVIHTFKGGK